MTTGPIPLPPKPNKGTYKEIWEALKNHSDKKIVVKCPRGHMETLIQAVKKIKSTENAARKRLEDMEMFPHWGRLVIHKDLQAGTVSFSLTYSVGDLV